MRDNKLKKLFTKGPKYQESKTISFGKAKVDFIACLNVSIETWYTKHGYEKTYSMNGNQI